VERRMLARQLPQEVCSKAEGVFAAHQAHRVLVLPVVGETELGNVSGDTEAGSTEPRVISQGSWSYGFEVKADASIIKAELVRCPGIDGIGIGEQAAQSDSLKVAVEPGEVVERRGGNGVVVEPAEAHDLLVRYVVINTYLVVVIQA